MGAERTLTAEVVDESWQLQGKVVPFGEGRQVRFMAEGLPRGVEVPVPLGLVQLYLIASNEGTR